MSMFYIRLFLLCSLIGPFAINAQNDFESLSESAFAINHKFSNNYKVNFALRLRSYIYQDQKFKYKQRQIDIVHFSTFSLNYNNSLSIGIQYRSRDLFDDLGNELRLTQQYNTIKKRFSKRFGHRFRVEQRIL